MSDQHEHRDGQPRRDGRQGGRLRGVARRLLDDPPGPGLREAKEVLGAVLDGSERARAEIVRLVGKELRGYLDGLGLKDDLHHLLTHYSLEVNASLRLKPLDVEEAPGQDGEPG